MRSGCTPASSSVARTRVGPRLGSADVDVTVGDVGHPVAQGGQVVDGADVRRRARSRRPRRRPGSRRTCRPRSRPSSVELAGEERLVGVALQDDRVAGGVVEPLGQRAQRRDADAGADQRDLAAGCGSGRSAGRRGPRPGRACPAAGAKLGGAAVADGLHGDPQAAAVGSGRQRVGVRAAPAGPGQEAPGEELPGLDAAAGRGDGRSRRPTRRRRPRETTDVTRSRCRRLRHTGRPTRQTRTAPAATPRRSTRRRSGPART